MSWSRTHTWWQIVREVVAEIERHSQGTLPWKAAYADVFPDPRSLRQALAYFWQLQVTGLADDPAGLAEFEAGHRGLRIVLFPSPSDGQPAEPDGRTSSAQALQPANLAPAVAAWSRL
jgi:hypothetical protein